MISGGLSLEKSELACFALARNFLCSYRKCERAVCNAVCIGLVSIYADSIVFAFPSVLKVAILEKTG
jgi:hypothetical protein